MSKRVICPYPGHTQYWIDLPDEWLGVHAMRRDETLSKIGEKNLGTTLEAFAVSLALLDDFSLPGFTGNPDKWDFTQIRLEIIAWVTSETLTPFQDCWNVKKAISSQSSNPSKTEKTEANQTQTG